MKSFHLAIPSLELFWFFFHRWWRQFSSILLRRNKFPKTSFDDIHFDWLQINSIGFHWFFSNRNDTHGILVIETDFQRNHIHKLFLRSSILQILISWIQINQNCFFRYSSLKLNFLRIPVDGFGFNIFSMEEINLSGFSVHEAHFLGFLLNGNKFLGFSRMKLISIDFHSTSFMLHGVTNADRFFPWVSEYLKLIFLLFSLNFFQWNFPKKIKLTCFSLRWILFRFVSLSMISVVFCVFCPWNSFLGFLLEDLFPWWNSY